VRRPTNSGFASTRRLKPHALELTATWPRSRLTNLSVRATVFVLVLVGSAVGEPAGTAGATPTRGVQAVVLSKQTVGEKDYIVAELTIASQGSTGWHTHAGEIYGVVKSGTLTHYSANCEQDGIYTGGDPITDPTGAEHVHLARNLGPEPVVLEVTYVNPRGAATSDSVPNPGCDIE
jgi:quercetin dioxygenase-like cupin family protein